MRGFEILASDVSLKVGICTKVKNGVIFALAVKLDEEFEIVDFLRKLLLLMSKAEFFGTKSADFFVTRKEEPRFNLRGLKDFAQSKNTATIIAANALWTHKDISVRGEANVVNGLFMNGVQMCHEHDGSLPVYEDKIAFIDESFVFKFIGESLEKLFLSWAQKVFQILHAGTS